MADAMNERMDVSGMNEDCFGLVTNRRPPAQSKKRALSWGNERVCSFHNVGAGTRRLFVCVVGIHWGLAYYIADYL